MSYAMAINSIAVAKVQQIIGICKFFDEKINYACIFLLFWLKYLPVARYCDCHFEGDGVPEILHLI